MLLKLDNASSRKTLQNFHDFMQWPVVNTLLQVKKEHHNQKDGSKGTQRLGPYWKLQPVICMVSMELKIRIVVHEQRQILTPGSEFLTAQTSL